MDTTAKEDPETPPPGDEGESNGKTAGAEADEKDPTEKVDGMVARRLRLLDRFLEALADGDDDIAICMTVHWLALKSPTVGHYKATVKHYRSHFETLLAERNKLNAGLKEGLAVFLKALGVDPEAIEADLAKVDVQSGKGGVTVIRARATRPDAEPEDDGGKDGKS